MPMKATRGSSARSSTIPNRSCWSPSLTGVVTGYVYAGVEPQSWKELRERAGFIHDVLVDEGSRRIGLADALLDRAIEWLREQHVPRVILWTAAQNDDAQRVFARKGFRVTMHEMTREL